MLYTDLNEATTWDNRDRTLLPCEIISTCSDQLQRRRNNLPRKSLLGEDLDYFDTRTAAIDDKESAREFLQTIEDFMSRKAHELAAVRKRLGMPEGLQRSSWPKSSLSQAPGKLWHASSQNRTLI